MKKKYVQAMIAGMTAMLSFTMPVTTVWAAVPEKEQTVYVNADENGNTEKIIVSNWLKNSEKDATLEDKSNLKNIQNVKGNETFVQDNDGMLTWNADGKDIYYQGETEEKLPVSVKLTYFLNGEEIPASELAGKSGKVKIRIDYENSSDIPFMMMTGMILPTETFTNIEVKNGKVISDGENNIVVGLGFPGLSESLKLSEIDGMDNDKIPDYVEIEADTKDFSLALTATVVTNGALKELGFDKIDSIDELNDKINMLTDSSELLVKGSKELQNGVAQLNASVDTFVSGLNSADSGAGQLKNGIDMMNNQKAELVGGVNRLSEGIGTLNSGAKTLQEGIKNYTENASNLSMGLGKLYGGLQSSMAGFAQLQGMQQQLEGLKTGLTGAVGYMNQAVGVIDSVSQDANIQQVQNVKNAMDAAGLSEEQKSEVLKHLGMISVNAQLNSAKQGLETIAMNIGNVKIDTGALTQLSEGMQGVSDAVKQLKDGSEALCSNNQALNIGAAQLAAGSDELFIGSAGLRTGAGELSNGIGQLANGAAILKNGTGQLAAGGTELKTGTAKLQEGSAQLAGGMQKFDDEGIQKLADVLQGELKNVLNRLKTVVDKDEAYTAFDGENDGERGKVKFIIKTAEIK